MITTNVGILKPKICTANLETNAIIEAADKYVSTATALKIMDSYVTEDLMRFNATIS